MLHNFLEGFLLGVTLSFLPGAAFFSLIQTSIHRGFMAGFFLAVGIFLSDITLVTLAYLGASQILADPDNQIILGVIGGIVLVLFGVYNFSRKGHVTDSKDIEVKRPGIFTYIMKGFALNTLNPTVWFFWGSITVLGTTRISTVQGVDNYEAIIYFGGILLAVFSVDNLKCFISHRIKKYLNNKVLTLINRLVGVMLIIFGMVLFYKVMLQLHWFA